MFADGKENKNYKGISKNFVRNSMQFENYKHCFFSQKEQMQKS